MTTYVWRKEDAKRAAFWRLVPSDKPSWHILGAIATIYPVSDYGFGSNRRRAYGVRYKWNSTGNKPESWAICGSVQSAKRWVESNLAAFWEPPEIFKV